MYFAVLALLQQRELRQWVLPLTVMLLLHPLLPFLSQSERAQIGISNRARIAMYSNCCRPLRLHMWDCGSWLLLLFEATLLQ